MQPCKHTQQRQKPTIKPHITMFNKEFYPTPENIIELMMEGQQIEGKTILEPSAGKGNIVDYLTLHGAQVLACEINEDLSKILQTKCKVIGKDFLQLESHVISHIDCIVMNPPFSNADEHILHAYSISPRGCTIIALCNIETINNQHTNRRKELKAVIDSYGSFEDIGNCFEEAERETGVKVALVKITKPGESYASEFEGFCMDEEPVSAGGYGIMKYDFIRDLVQRYIGAVKIYDNQLNEAVKMNDLLHGFYDSSIAMSITEGDKPTERESFKKDLQKSAWKFIFSKMNMNKYATRGLREEINKFVEQQVNVPFTMKNIYIMLDIVMQTTEQRMDRAIIEVFDKLTLHHADNRYNVPGWKTNSHYLVGKKFIFPYMIDAAKSYGYTSESYSLYNHRCEIIEDFEKALCYITGRNHDEIIPVHRASNRNEYGEWYDGAEFFKYKGFKKGTIHFEFKSEDVWAIFNQRVAKIKGYPLFEAKQQTKYQEKQTGRDKPKGPNQKEPVIFGTYKVA